MFKIFCDFDNTITHIDTINDILDKFTEGKWLKLERLYEDKVLSAKKCLEQQISLLKVEERGLKNYILNNIKISDGFLSFVDMCKKLNYRLTIVSDGLDFVIKIILKAYNISRLTYFSNKLLIDKNGNFKAIFPFYQKSCKAFLGCCKCAIVNQYKQLSQVIYIGDGSSDFCVSANYADIVFAKDKLALFCKKYNILHYKFKNFWDVKDKLTFLINSEK